MIFPKYSLMTMSQKDRRLPDGLDFNLPYLPIWPKISFENTPPALLNNSPLIHWFLKNRRMLIGELVNSPQGLHSVSFDEENSNDHSGSVMNTTSPELVEKSELLSETSNTMTLEQFTDIVLASEGMTMNNINNNTECTNSSSTGLGSAHGGATPTKNMTLNGGIEKVSIIQRFVICIKYRKH